MVVYPSLSTKGFVTDDVSKLDFLLSDFFTSDYNQSYLYTNKIVSITKIIQDTGGDIALVISELKAKLIDYLSSYFNNIAVDILPDGDINTDVRSRMNLRITISIISKRDEFTFLLKTESSKFSSILKLNNGV